MKLIHDRVTGEWHHYCPACDELHRFAVDKPFSFNGHRWSFNGNLEAPTFIPSMNIQIGPYPAFEDHQKRGQIDICHYFLRDGVILFLGDCTHTLKGSSVALPDIPERFARFADIIASRVEKL